MKRDVGLVVLAAGSSVRYQGVKLLEMVDGKKMYQHLLENVKDIDMEPKILVTQYEEIAEYAELAGFTVVMNHKPEEGISRSIHLGIEAILECNPKVEGMMFCVSDQPYLKKKTIQEILHEFREEKGSIVSAAFEDMSGNPCVFDKVYFKELLALEGDCGGKLVIKMHEDKVKYLQIENEKELLDIDARTKQ